MKGRRLGARLLAAVLMTFLLGGCSFGSQVTEDMIPEVTDLGADSVTGLSMNASYMAELIRLDGDNTQEIDAQSISLVLKTTSVYRDLKIKIVNEKSNKVITGTAFEVSVTDSANTTQSYTDSDEDGIIYIESMEPGKCTISMTFSGAYTAAADITAEVKAQLEYTVVDVSDEIKDESEINVAQEDTDTTGNSDAGTAQVLTDTVEYVESTKTPIIETIKTQKVDDFGQLVYSKLQTDQYGNEMYAVVISEPASEHEDADGDHICDRCQAESAHSYTETVTAPTCQTEGYTTYTCSCGASYTGNTVPASKERCVDSGNGYCSVCGESISSSTQTSALNTGSITLNSLGLQTLSLRLLAATTSEVIVYDTTSAPIYDTSSDPVYEITEQIVGYTYTGWQTIDGATYYFDKNGNKVTGTQVIQGIQYTFSDEGVRSGTIGIDVSKYQTSIDWQKVKNAGINFVIIRCGYRGYGTGVLVQDPMFASHITGAKAAGLRVGIYFFSQAITEAEAIEEASMAVKLANQYGINMPIAIDSEYANAGNGRADGLSKSARTKITIAFCNTVASAGYTPMVYASKNWFSEHLDVSQFPSSYRIWVAHYATTCGYTGRYEIWQNTSKGTVDGVSGNVDMNISSI